jgi:phosphohistidine phosphatase
MGPLYLLRHAKSSWDDPALADHDRPLSTRGRRNAATLAEHVRREGIAPALVLCSTAARARETLAVVLPAIDVEAEIRLEDALYGASADELLDRLRSVPETAGSVLVVGHNPTLEDLAARLAPGEAPERLPTCAFVELEAAGPWANLGESPCRIVSVTIPR